MDKTKIGIIGSGFGGLATAIRLQASGFQVTILEKRDKAGGRAYVYEDQGFKFDAGPTVVTAPGTVSELFEMAGRRMEDYVTLQRVTPMYRLHWEDGTQFDYTEDLNKTIEQIRKLNPQDAEKYPDFLKYTEKVFEEGFTKLAHVPFLDWWSMIRVSPQLLGLEAYRSVYSIVSKYLKDPHLRQAFSFHSLLVGGNPFSASAIYTLIHFLERKWGVYFAMGGTGALVNGLLKLFCDLGGEVLMNAEVDEISTHDGKVSGIKTRDGRDMRFDAVVSNADVARTYLDLLRKESRLDSMRRRMARAKYSMSLFLIYFGTKKLYPKLAHHNVMFCSRYKALLDEIFKGHSLADDFSLYVHAPTLTDPSLAPLGCHAYYALSPVPHLGNLKIDWSVEGPKYGQKILDYLESRYMPGLKQDLVTSRVFTPEDFKTELNAHLGSAFSLEPLLTQSAFFRTHNRDEKIKGLYFVGAGTHPGAGIPGVISSAKATAGLMVEDLSPVRENIVVTAPKGSNDEVEVALAQCREMIHIGSKSFSLASRLFGEQAKDAACFLYGWCRYCDDQIDETVNLRLQEERVRYLKDSTEKAFRGGELPHPVFIALREIARKYGIPYYYAGELIEGMAMDVRKERYWTIEDLTLYCYRVAGTVGLMMSHVMGVSREGALKQATDMGIAMQMTNIARDVMEDAKMGRVYLPLGWLDEVGVTETEVAKEKHRRKVSAVAVKLLDEAEKYYRSGNSGLKYLPFRACLAVAVASSVYSEIGYLVRSRGEMAWDERCYVTGARKWLAVARGIGLALSTIPARIMKPFRPVMIQNIWRHA